MGVKQIRSLRELKPEAAVEAGEWSQLCTAKGIPVLIYETRRTPERQDYLHAQGRTRPGPIITNAEAWESWHQYGVAWDACPWEYYLKDREKIGRKLDWDPFDHRRLRDEFMESRARTCLDKQWRVLAEAADELGISWAGDWKTFTEWVHFYVPLGLSLEEWREKEAPQ